MLGALQGEVDRLPVLWTGQALAMLMPVLGCGGSGNCAGRAISKRVGPAHGDRIAAQLGFEFGRAPAGARDPRRELSGAIGIGRRTRRTAGRTATPRRAILECGGHQRRGGAAVQRAGIPWPARVLGGHERRRRRREDTLGHKRGMLLAVSAPCLARSRPVVML